MIEEDTLVNLYHGRGLSQRQVADELDVSRKTVQRWMGEHDIQSRSKSEAISIRNRKKPVPFVHNSEGYEAWHDQSFQVSHGETWWVLHHRLLAVAEYGLEEVKDKVVHHRNGIRWDNRPDNIEPLDAGEHTSLHEANRDYGNDDELIPPWESDS